jgi:hypothetical protein
MGLTVNQWIVGFESLTWSHRGISSVARALHLQCRGQRLDPAILHQRDCGVTAATRRLERRAERRVGSSPTSPTKEFK